MFITFYSCLRSITGLLTATAIGACTAPDGAGRHAPHHPDREARGGRMMGSQPDDMGQMCAIHRHVQNTPADQRQAMLDQQMKGMSPEMRRQHMEMMRQHCK